MVVGLSAVSSVPGCSDVGTGLLSGAGAGSGRSFGAGGPAGRRLDPGCREGRPFTMPPDVTAGPGPSGEWEVGTRARERRRR